MRSYELVIAHDFRDGAWGGGNQFLRSLATELEGRGFNVHRGLPRSLFRSRATLVNSYGFPILRTLAVRPLLGRVVHRIDGPIGKYRGATHGIDRRIWLVNRLIVAHTSVLQSTYSADAHARLGFRYRNPTIITNATDASIYHPPEDDPRGPPYEVISTSWSPNPRKGAEMYEKVSRLLPSDYRWRFVGRSPIPFSRIEHHPPVGRTDVAAMLRECHVFVTASQFEPCSNAVVEALACGLPVAYLDSGSHREVVGASGLPFRTAEEGVVAIQHLAEAKASGAARVRAPCMSDVADAYVEALFR